MPAEPIFRELLVLPRLVAESLLAVPSFSGSRGKLRRAELPTDGNTEKQPRSCEVFPPDGSKAERPSALFVVSCFDCFVVLPAMLFAFPRTC
jgi:hypothetical protein